MEGKSIFRSKTFWVNTLAIVISMAGVFGLDLSLEAEEQTAIVTTIMGIVNIFLRLTTKEPIKAIASAE